jgi:hypothetical protein
LLLMPLPLPWHGSWRSKLLDLGHVPLFGGLTLCLWLLLGGRLLGPVLFALALAGLAEIVQPYFGRTGDIFDFLRGALGILAAAALVRACRRPRTVGRVAAYVLVALGLVAWPVGETAPHLLDAYQGYRTFPTLADFDTAGEMLRWECSQAVLTREPDPDRPGRWLGRLDLLPGKALYPGARLEPVIADWSGYRRVACAFTVVGRPLRLVFSVRSGSGVKGRTTHYQVEKVYPPGDHKAYLDLELAARKAHPLPLDLTQVRYFHIFTYNPEATRTARLHRVWLEAKASD